MKLVMGKWEDSALTWIHSPRNQDANLGFQ